MKSHNLTFHNEIYELFKNDLIRMDKNKSYLFFNRMSQKLDEVNVSNFDKVKDWELIHAFEDSCFYADELAIVLKDKKEYAVLNYYNAGPTVVTNMRVEIVSNKQELKEVFNKSFAFNGLDSITNQRIAPRFDFGEIIDKFPEVIEKTVTKKNSL